MPVCRGYGFFPNLFLIPVIQGEGKLVTAGKGQFSMFDGLGHRQAHLLIVRKFQRHGFAQRNVRIELIFFYFLTVHRHGADGKAAGHHRVLGGGRGNIITCRGRFFRDPVDPRIPGHLSRAQGFIVISGPCSGGCVRQCCPLRLTADNGDISAQFVKRQIFHGKDRAV